MQTLTDSDIIDGYYTLPAACFVRDHLRVSSADPPALVRKGLEEGVPLYGFKRSRPLPRVKRVIGTLKGLHPETLLDIGSGRGVFLWPLMDAFPGLPITAVDLKRNSLDRLMPVSRGGMNGLLPIQADVRSLPFDQARFDCVTALEVLEHLRAPEEGLDEILRVARRAVVVIVPSRPDNNPEHLHLLTQGWFEKHLDLPNVQSVSFDYVLNHLICVAIIRQKEGH